MTISNYSKFFIVWTYASESTISLIQLRISEAVIFNGTWKFNLTIRRNLVAKYFANLIPYRFRPNEKCTEVARKRIGIDTVLGKY